VAKIFGRKDILEPEPVELVVTSY